MEEKIVLSKSEYEEMVNYVHRLQETIDVMSNKEIVRKLNSAIDRIEKKGEYLTKEEVMENV